MKRNFLSGACLLALSTVSHAAKPQWIADGSSAAGGRVVAIGTSKSSDLTIARKNAQKGCITSAMDFLSHEYSIESTTIQGERDSGLFESVQISSSINNLPAVSISEYSEETDGNYTVWLRCVFDAKKPSILSKIVDNAGTDFRAQADQLLFIAASPACTSILLVGTAPRIIRCTKNPEVVAIRKGDTRMIIRSDGYKPATVDLTSQILKDGNLEVKLGFH